MRTRPTLVLSLILAGSCSGRIGDPVPVAPQTGPVPTDIRDVTPYQPPVSPPPQPVVRPESRYPAADPETPAPPITGGTLLVLRDGTTAVAADPDRDRVWVVDLGNPSRITEIVLPAGDEPGRLVEDRAGRVHVAARRGGVAVSLAGAPLGIVDRRSVCPSPRGIAYDGVGDQVHVACADGVLVTLPAAGGPATRTLRLERDLRDVVVQGDTLLVSTFRSAKLLVIDAAGQVRERLSPATALNLTRRDKAGAAGPATTRFEPAVAWRTVPMPGGGALMLHQRAFTGEIIADSTVGGGSYGGPTCTGIVQTVVSRLRPGLTDKAAADIAGLVLAVDIALTPDGSRFAAVSPANSFIPKSSVPDDGSRPLPSLPGSQIVSGEVLPNIDGTPCLFPIEPPPPTTPPDADPPPPPEEAWIEGGGIIRNRVAGEAVAVAFDGAGDVVVQLREPAALLVPHRRLRIALPAASRLDTGHAVFHGNTGGGIACASCHPEGGEDGRVWLFTGIGRRRTQSLRGGVSQTLPLHWDGDMQDVAHIGREVFTGRMGGPELRAAETRSLSRWIESIPFLPALSGDQAAVARGRALFTSQATGCFLCHAGPRYTNNQSVDVGTGRAFQVPSLVGAAWRAPYMHDGCAATPGARFQEGCGGSRHGTTADLTAAGAADLQAFIESL